MRSFNALPPRGLQIWFVVFCRRPDWSKPTFFHRLFTGPRWSHVWAYAWDPDHGVYITIDPIGNNMVVDAVPVLDHPTGVLNEVMGREDTQAVVLFQKYDNQRTKFHYHGFHTCVTVIKDLLGINRFSVQTPRGLYDYLIRNGGISYMNRRG